MRVTPPSAQLIVLEVAFPTQYSFGNRKSCQVIVKPRDGQRPMLPLKLLPRLGCLEKRGILAVTLKREVSCAFMYFSFAKGQGDPYITLA